MAPVYIGYCWCGAFFTGDFDDSFVCKDCKKQYGFLNTIRW